MGITLGKIFPCFDLKITCPHNAEEKTIEVTVIDGCQDIEQSMSVLHQIASILLKWYTT